MVAQNFEEQPELEEIWKREFMLGRLSNPNEFRGVVIILLSKASNFMTGVRLNVNGGRLLARVGR
jgi:NAD(P)-dependent dehydrogenase (short-subunit alcohol dehydrogenase family)